MSSPTAERSHTVLEVLPASSNPLEKEIKTLPENTPLSTEIENLELSPDILAAALDEKAQNASAVPRPAAAEATNQQAVKRPQPNQPAAGADSKATSGAGSAPGASEADAESTEQKPGCCPCCSRCCDSIMNAIDACIPQKCQPCWNHPAGPKTIFFWAPLIKWLLVLAGIADLARPAEAISVAQSLALALTGMIWSRYSLVIIPKNWALFSVNFFVALTQTVQLIRALHNRIEQGKW